MAQMQTVDPDEVAMAPPDPEEPENDKPAEITYEKPKTKESKEEPKKEDPTPAAETTESSPDSTGKTMVEPKTLPETPKEEPEKEEPDNSEFKLPISDNSNQPMHHTSKKIIIGVIIALIFAVVAVGLIWLLHDDPVDTTAEETAQVQVYSLGAAITYVDGTVEYNIGDGWNEVTQGLSLKDTQQVRTGADSRAIIALDDGSAIRLNASSSVELTTLSTDQVVVKNVSGEVYTRVTESDSRTFEVMVDDQAYIALGTAYKTVNTEKEAGAEVYHSKVDVKDKAELGEGESFFTKSADEAKKDKVAKIDLEKLKDDEFLKWNKEQDEKETDFVDKLGVLKDIDKEEAEEETTPPPASTPTAGITASGVKVSEGIKVSWSVNGIDASNGFKITYSKDDTTPSYGENSAKYVSPGESTKTLELTDGKTWHIRVCAYKGDSLCTNYSNTVTVVAPYVEPELVTRGTIDATLTGDVLSWSYTGVAPYGYKVVWNTTGSPVYPGSDYKYLSSPSATQLDLSDKITTSGTYYVSVCAYTSGTESTACWDYADDETYIVP